MINISCFSKFYKSFEEKLFPPKHTEKKTPKILQNTP